MNWLVDNWYLVVAGLAGLAFVIYCLYTFFGMPTEKQIEKVKEWLIFATLQAEKELQSGTGQLKLRQVYNMFCAVPAFTWIAKVVSFDLFSMWVADSLVEVKQMLINNKTLAEYVYGKSKAESEVKKIKEQLGV